MQGLAILQAENRSRRAGTGALLARLPGVAVLAALAWALATQDLRLVAGLAVLTVGAICAIRAPWIVWAAIGAILPFAAAYKFGVVSLLDVALLAAFGLWFLDGVRKGSLRLAHSAPALLAMVYSTLLLLASIGARDLQQAIVEVIKWVQFAAVVAILPAVVERRQVQWVVLGVVAGATAQAAFGLYQFVFRIGPEWFVVLGRYMRASGTFAQPNPFAGYLGLVLPVVVSLTVAALGDLWREPRRGRFWLWAGVYGGATAVIAAGLLASWSRGGWLAAAAAGVVVLALQGRRAALALGVGGVVVGALLLAGSFSPNLLPEPVAARLSEIPSFFGSAEMLYQEVNDDNFAVIERLAHWEAAKRMFALSPWLGVGPGNYAALYPDVRLPLWSEALGHAHNYYLNVLAESGVVGFVAFLLLWGVSAVWVVRRVYTARKERPTDIYGAALGVGIVGVLVHLAAHSIVDNLMVQGMYVLVALWLALLQARQKTSPAEVGTSLIPEWK